MGTYNDIPDNLYIINEPIAKEIKNKVDEVNTVLNKYGFYFKIGNQLEISIEEIPNVPHDKVWLVNALQGKSINNLTINGNQVAKNVSHLVIDNDGIIADDNKITFNKEEIQHVIIDGTVDSITIGATTDISWSNDGILENIKLGDCEWNKNKKCKGDINMITSKSVYEVLKGMTNDLMKAEEFINAIGVETRQGKGDDEFRSIADILKDVVTVVNNNPTIIDDASKQNFSTSYEIDKFLSKYNLSGITVMNTYMRNVD